LQARPETYPKGEHLNYASLVQALDLLVNIRLSWKSLPRSMALVYVVERSVTKEFLED
jgi:hypothetical protein